MEAVVFLISSPLRRKEVQKKADRDDVLNFRRSYIRRVGEPVA